MKTVTVQVSNKSGLHARSAAELVKLTSQFKARIEIEKEGQKVDGKSIMAILTLAAACHSTLTIRAFGEDDEVALEAIVDLFKRSFTEEEEK